MVPLKISVPTTMLISCYHLYQAFHAIQEGSVSSRFVAIILVFGGTDWRTVSWWHPAAKVDWWNEFTLILPPSRSKPWLPLFCLYDTSLRRLHHLIDSEIRHGRRRISWMLEMCSIFVGCLGLRSHAQDCGRCQRREGVRKVLYMSAAAILTYHDRSVLIHYHRGVMAWYRWFEYGLVSVCCCVSTVTSYIHPSRILRIPVKAEAVRFFTVSLCAGLLTCLGSMSAYLYSIIGSFSGTRLAMLVFHPYWCSRSVPHYCAHCW